VRRKELANTLRQLRTESKLTLEDAARHLELSAATLSRIETGIRIPRARDVRDLVQLYGVTDERRVAHIVGLVAGAKEPGWWEAYSEVDEEFATLMGLEIAATRLQQYGGMVIPGLLQTPDYTRAYLREATNPGRARPFSDQEIEKRLEIRVRRQQAIVQPPGVPYEAILDEAVLRRRVAGAQGMREQLLALIELGSRPHISIRMLAFDIGAHPGQPGGFTILTLPQPEVSDVVYVDSLAGQLFLENAVDLERHRRGWGVLYERALDEEATQEALHRMASGGGSD